MRQKLSLVSYQIHPQRQAVEDIYFQSCLLFLMQTQIYGYFIDIRVPLGYYLLLESLALLGIPKKILFTFTFFHDFPKKNLGIEGAGTLFNSSIHLEAELYVRRINCPCGEM